MWPPTPPPQQGPKPSEKHWIATQRDWYSTVWQSTDVASNSVTGQLTTETNRYVELANGLNYIDASHNWQPSADSIVLLTNSGGAAALQGPTKVYFPPSLGGTNGRVTIVTASNTVFQLQPAGLYYFDLASGKSVLLASLREAQGELLPPNRVIYRDAFQGLMCNIAFTYTKGAFESDLVLLQRPKAPEAYGLNSASTLLQVYHRMQGPAPQRITSRFIPSAKGAGPALVDETADFGELWFPQGKAFSWTETTNAPEPSPDAAARVNLPGRAFGSGAVPVAKTWGQIGGEPALLESVRWSDIAEKLDSLPLANLGAGLSAPAKKGDLVREVPLLAREDRTGAKAMTVALAGDERVGTGLIIDYTTISSGGTTYTFMNNTTYYVSSFVSYSSTVTFYGGCVIKFANSAGLYLRGPVNSSGTSGNPSVLTSVNENIFGEAISGSTGTPTYSADEAIWLDYTGSAQTFNGMTIRWAQVAIEVDGNGSGLAHTLNDSSVQWCQTAVYASSCGIVFQQSTKCNVSTLIQAYGTNAGYSGTLTDICSGDSDNNGLADATEYEYFGRLGTLQGHVIGQLNGRIAGKNPANDQGIYTAPLATPPDDTLNSGCWLAGVTGVSSFSPYHDSAPGNASCLTWHCTWYSRGGTLITPRHAITVDHMSCCFSQTSDAWIRFVDINGSAHDARVLKLQNTTSGATAVMVLDRDMPSTVQYAQVLPSNVTNKICRAWQTANSALAANLPTVGCNQFKQAFIVDDYDMFSGMSAHHSLWFPTWGSRQYPAQGTPCWGTDIISGDSGSPTYLLLNGHLVLIGTWATCYDNDFNGSTWVGPIATLVNDTIYGLDSWVTSTYGTNAMTGYAVSLYDLSGFPDLR